MNIFSSFTQLVLAGVLLLNTMLAFVVFTNNRKSVTNIIFAFLSIVTSVWLVLIYKTTTLSSLSSALLYTRFTVFFAVPQSVLFFLLAHTLPSTKLLLKKRHLLYILVATFLMMFFTLTPYVFKGVQIQGENIESIPGAGIPIFAAFTSFFSLAAIYTLIKKIRSSTGDTKQQLMYMMRGILFMLGLIIGTIMIPVIFFHSQVFIPFAPLYALIFLGMTGYSIVRFHLFNLKVIATEAFVALLLVLFLSRIFIATSIQDTVVSILIFLVTTIFSFLLVRSVRKEVKQKEEMATLADSLEKANVLLKEADKQKTEFLTIASHQLRTPLSILKGYIELIKDGSYGKVEPTTMKVLDDMDLNNEHLVKLVDTLLDITRIEQGRTKYSFATNNICALIDESVSDLKLKAKEKKMKLVWSCPKKMADVYCDQEKMHHVIYNFIDNALKYSEKGTVKVILEEQDGGIAMRVIDNGIGFNKVDENNFFQKFYRGDNVRTIGISGTGLGLYVCRKFIEAHSGRVWAHSEGLGKGSEFGFWIPINLQDHAQNREYQLHTA